MNRDDFLDFLDFFGSVRLATIPNLFVHGSLITYGRSERKTPPNARETEALLNTFVPLYWVDLYKQSKASGATALTIVLSAGIAGHFLGGRLADRYGQRAMIKVAFGSLFLVLLPFAMKPDITFSTLLLIPIGMATALSYSPMVVMGQSFLPGRVALSSGITLGLTVSAGGMIVPLFGRLADSHGLGAVLWATTAVPVLATLLAFTLPLPQIDK